MRSIARLGTEEARHLAGLLFDLDDTLLTDGRLTEAAYSALHRLRESGLTLVAVTGRPLAWARVLARQWPVAGVVAENGAVAAFRDGRIATVRDFAGAERVTRAKRLEELTARLERDFPALVRADEPGARCSDITFDIGETHHLAPESVSAVARAAHALGLRTFASSVHLHVTLDALDKAAGALRFASERLGVESGAALSRLAFIGDSENDASCFAAFRTSIGVGNLQGKFTIGPRYITEARCGAGFVEAAEQLVTARRGDPS